MKNHSLRSHRTSMSLRLLFSLLTAVVMLLMVATAGAGVTLTATKTDALVGDLDGDSQADPGDTLEYIVVITNNTGAPVNNVVFADTVDANTSFVSGSLVASPVAINDTYPQIIIGNVSIDSSLIPYSVTSNDFLGLNATTTISAFDATSASGGQVTMTTSGANMGQFTYNPPPGFEGTDTFTYTLNNSSGSNTATVSITVSGMVWFIKNGVSLCTTLAAGCGRLSNPFSTLGAFNALNDGSGSNPAANDNIFVYESASEYTGAVTLLSGQKLIGQDATASLETITGLTRPSSSPAFPAMNSGNGTVTNLGSTVTLNNNVTVRGLQINSATSTGMNDPAGAITGVAVSEVSVSSTTATAVALSDLGGTFAFTSISSNGGTSDGISIANQTGSFTVDGDGSNTAVGGNGTGGTIQNKSGADGSTSSGIGIYLNNVNNITLRRMTINGTNQNYGIRGFAVNNFTLEYATVGGANGTAASLAAPENAGEGSIYFGNYSTTGLTGSATVNKVSVSGGRARNFSVINTSGTLNRLTIMGSNFGLNQDYIDANQSLAVEARNSGTAANVTVRGSTFAGSPGDLVNFTNQIGSTMDVVFGGSGIGENNTLSNSHAKNTIGGGGMTLATGGTMTLNVTNNTFRDANGSAITLQLAAPLAGDTSATSLNGTLTGNTIGVSGVAGSGSKTGNGIFLSFADNTTSPKGQVTLAITNNIIRQYSGNAAIYDDNTGGNYNADLTITGNTTDQPGAGVLYGLALTAGAPSSSDDIDVCASITGNNISAGDPNNNNDVIVGVSTALSSMRLPGYTGNSLAQVEKFIRDNNSIPSAPAVTAYVTAPATKDNFIGGAACSTPSAYLRPSGNRRMVAQANIDGSGLDRAPRQNEKENAGFNLALDLSKWLKQTASVNKVAGSASSSGDHQLSSAPASHRLALPSLSTLVDSLGQLFAISTASAAPAEMPKSAPDVTVTVGALPGNKSVTIKFRATIAADPTSNVTQVSNQGTATFDGGFELTDDPATPALNDATITEIPQPDLIVTKTNNVSGSIPQGGNWKWKLTVQNNGRAASLFGSGQTILVDALPGTNISYNPPAVSNFNGTGTINCAIAGNTLTCTATAGTAVTIPANTGKFDVEFTATPSAVGTFTNPTGGTCKVDPNGNVVESDETNNACNSNSVTVVAPPVISKTFGASNIALNGTTALTIALTNPTANSVALTGVAMTDPLPAGLQVAGAPNASNTCGITFAPASGATTLNASGITLGAGSSCTLKVDVTGTTPGPKTNTTDAVTSANGGSGNSASATLQVAMPPVISKAFGAASKAVNETTALTFAITNTDSVFSLTGVGFTDNLPSGLQVASTPNASNTCGGTFTTPAGGSAITLANATLGASGNCSLSVDVVGTTVGAKNNATSHVTSNEGGSGNAASASITVAQGASTISLVKTPVTAMTYGDTIYFTATVAAAFTGPAAPSGGTVQFFDNGAAISGAVALSGSQAFFSTSSLTAGTHNNLTAVYSGDTNFSPSSPSSPVTQQVNRATPTFSNLSSPTIPYGTPTTTVSGKLVYGSLIPSGNVIITINGVEQPAAINASTGNFASDFATGALGVAGSPYVIAFNYSGDTNFAAQSDNSHTLSVAKDNTSIAASSSANPSTYGQTVTISAKVTSSGPSTATPTGMVTFTIDGSLTLTGAVNGSGIASIDKGDLTVGAHSVQMDYSGDGNFNPSTQTFAQNVGKATPVFSNLSAPTIGYGTTPTTITGALKLGTLIPSGSVTITVNGVSQLAAIDPITGNFTSSFATGALAIAGSPYPISFNYAGDTNFASATGASNLIVTPAPTTATVIGHTPSPSIFNQSVTFTATVTSAQGAPTGTVTLNEGATLLGTGTLNAGTVTFNLSSLSVGTHTITASYQANGNYAASTSPSVTHIVNLAPTTATITGHAPSPSVFNQMVTFTATVTSTQGSPTGNVTLNDGATSVATGVLNSGVVTFTISTLAVGSHTMTAAYQTDASFADSTSPSITHLVNQANTTTTVTSSSPTTVFGQSLTFTATVNSTQGTPTGTVTFYDGVTSLGTGSLDGSGIAALTTSTLTVTGSPHTITARYDGDTNFSTSTSVGIPQTVNKASTTAALNASSTNPTYGQSVYLTATLSITAPGAGTPTGTITFYDGATPLYTGTLSSNVVTFVTNTLIVNGGVAHNLTAKYNGDLNFNASPSSPAVNVTVNRATLNVSADNKMKVYGAPLPTLTVTYSGFGLGQDATVLTGSPTLTTVPATSPVGSYPITVTVGSLTAANYVFNLVNGTLTISAAQLTVSANNQSKLYGALNPTLTYSITGFVNSDTQSTALTGAPGLSTSATASSIVGTYPISVTQGTLRNTNLSALNYAFTLVNGTLTVNKDNTSARLTGAAPNPSTYGQAVAFTATVTSTQGIMVSGSVTFKDGATTLGSGILNASGVVTFTTSALTASGSPHSVTATFAGSSNFNASAASSAVKQTVNKATTATTLYAPTPNPSVAGQAITVSFSVAVNPPGAGTPTGTVTVTDGTASCTAPAGSTSCRITFNTAGTKTLTATYGGDVNFASSASSAIAHTVTLPTCSVPAVSNRTPFNLQNPAYRTFLPLILGNAVHAPDLIVQSILPVTTTLQVVLLNQGNEPVKDDFWVDLYINPNPIPTQVNQTWPFLATQGAVWGVVASSAAVPAGGTLKLNVGGPYYWSQLSTMPASLPAGSCVYVQVDSANASTNYGAVLEDHEMQNGTYNNITGIRLDSPITISAPRSVLSPRVTGTPLPSRPTQ